MSLDWNLIEAAHSLLKRELLSERTPEGYWVGELASSPLSTATAISATCLSLRNASHLSSLKSVLTNAPERIEKGLAYLGKTQNIDGGWGDTDLSASNISTTWLVLSALELANVGGAWSAPRKRAQDYVEKRGGIPAIPARYGKDKTFAVPILTNAALAGLAPWNTVSPLPFELACLPPAWWKTVRLPVVSYALPALVAIGQCVYAHRPPRNPLMRWLRRGAIAPSLRVLQEMQPASGGYLEAVPLTSFVVMSLVSSGQSQSSVVENGLRFLNGLQRQDGAWPIDTDLATWNTTLALNGFAAGGEMVATEKTLDWLLGCQHRKVHPFTKAAPGGWAWTNHSGGVPDADDTPGALLALATLRDQWPARANEIDTAAKAGVRWLLDLQNGDGGWPTFCKGWGTLPFDRSGADLTAHVIRAFVSWTKQWSSRANPHSDKKRLLAQLQRANERGFRYLKRQQQSSGAWTPLWFGNERRSDESNPLYGTAKALLAYRDADQLGTEAAQRGLNYLVGEQLPDGSWGPPRENGDKTARNEAGPRSSPQAREKAQSIAMLGSIEETSLALEALISAPSEPKFHSAMELGANRLSRAIVEREHIRPTPIGFYFAKLWYYERLYPKVFALGALGALVAKRARQRA